MVLDNGDLGGQIIGVEMLEANNHVEFAPEMERRVSERFRSWMGTSYLSDDGEDENQEVSHLNSFRQRVKSHLQIIDPRFFQPQILIT